MYTITKDEMDKIRSALTLAEYFVQEHMDSKHNPEDESTLNDALQVMKKLGVKP